MEWVVSIGLESYAPNLKERGVHGGVLALDNDYGPEKFSLALQIPLNDIEVCIYVCAHSTNPTQ